MRSHVHPLRRVLRLFLAALLVAGVAPVSGLADEPGANGSEQRSRIDRSVPDDVARNATSRIAEGDYVEGEILVRFKPGIGVASRASVHAQAGGRRAKSFRAVPGLELVDVPRGMRVEQAIAAYERLAAVEYAEPNYVRTLAALPDDVRFGELWGLHNTGQSDGTAGADIKAPAAWEITTGSREVIVAVLDTGVDYTHPDLAANMWVNPGEVAGTGVDDDGNGYIDDVHGINAITGTGDPFDDHGHGTHCAGTIGAVGDNGIGITGVNWDVSIMAVKMLDANGNGTVASAIAAFEYAAAHGADIISNSWGGFYPFSQAEYDAIASIDALFVFAAGNEGRDNDGLYKYYPASYDLPNIISVGASDHNDQRAGFSNIGATTVDVFAPGVGILSTVPTGTKTFVPDVDEVLFSHDFSTTVGWDLSYYDGTPWARSTSVYVSAPSSLGYTGYEAGDGAFADSPAIDCSGVETVFVNAKVRYDMGPDDVLYVDVHDGTDWWVVKSMTGSSDGEFEDVWIDVSEWAAGVDDFRVSFAFESGGSSGSVDGYEGVYVDDVRVVTPVETGTYFADSFDSLDAWDVSEYEVKAWELSSARTVSPPTSLAHRDYADDEFSLATQRDAIDMRGADAALLRFKARYDIEGMYDWFMVATLNDGTPHIPLARTGDSERWRTHSALLPTAPGQNVAAAFVLASDEEFSSAAGYEGVYVDDVEWVGLSGTWVAEDASRAYAYKNGTSMATPHVAGIAALLLSVDPTVDWETLKGIILDTAEPRPALAGLCVTGARVDAVAALVELAGDTIPPVTTASGIPAGWTNTDVTVTLSATDSYSGVAATYYRIGAGEDTTYTAPFTVTVEGQTPVAYWSVDNAENVEAEKSATVRIDRTPPQTSAEVAGDGSASVSVTLSAHDALSGVATTRWRLGDAGGWTAGTSVTVMAGGDHTLYFYSADNAGNAEEPGSVTFTVVEPPPPVIGVAGADRVATAIEASKRAYPDDGSVDTVVIATAMNWPDALGGTALAGALDGPVLLVNSTLAATVSAEIARLGAQRAIVLGGTGAVSTAVESALKIQLGAANVERLDGADRYQTADKVAVRTIAESTARGDYDGTAFVATGANFPDALAAAPLAAAGGWPLFLANPATGLSPASKAAMSGVERALVLGGEAVVKPETETYLTTRFGTSGVTRLAGPDRYTTAVAVAMHAVEHEGHVWDRVGITTGANFPDALAGGVVQGKVGSVMLLTTPNTLSTCTALALSANKDAIDTVTFYGGDGAVSPAVRAAVMARLQ